MFTTLVNAWLNTLWWKIRQLGSRRECAAAKGEWRKVEVEVPSFSGMLWLIINLVHSENSMRESDIEFVQCIYPHVCATHSVRDTYAISVSHEPVYIFIQLYTHGYVCTYC